MLKILALILLPFIVIGQNTIGFPEVINYSRQHYQGGLQNWDIDQDPKTGVIYFANNEGLLSFDGKYWGLYSLPNKTIVRSVKLGKFGKILVGGQDELGYFEPNRSGILVYHSLLPILSEKERSFGDIWDIVPMHQDIFFRSSGIIFQITGNSSISYKAPVEWSYLGACNGQLYAHDLTSGIHIFKNGTWQPLESKNTLPPNDPVTSILPLSNGRFMITTLKHGIYYGNENSLTKHPLANNNLFSDDRIYSATSIEDNLIALATNNRGVYIIDTLGNIVQHFSKKEQLQNDNVLSIYPDNQKNLWLGLDNGIDFIAYNSPIKKIKPDLQDYSGYSAIIQNNRLYTATSNGLFSIMLENIRDLSFSKGTFNPVLNTRGQNWSLASINNKILLGHHEGVFQIEDSKAELISAEPGYWNFIPTSPVFPARELIAGHYKGLRFFETDGNQFKPGLPIPGFDESSRYLAIDRDGHYWVSHPYHGVYRISKNSSNTFEIVNYANQKGLPSKLNNHVFLIKNEIVVGTTEGVFIYNHSKNIFERSAYYNKLLGTKSIRYLKEDKEGNIWFIHEKNLGVIDLNEQNPRVIFLPELTNKMLSGFESIYALDENNIFLGGEKGFYHINYAKYKNNVPILSVQIRNVIIRNKKDSILFGGFISAIESSKETTQITTPSINHNWKTIRFEYASPLFGYQSNLEYSYRLKGFDISWSNWSNRCDKEYTNLNPGNYVFEVKVRNNLGTESNLSSYAFTILPPWYWSIWAKMMYVVLMATCLYFIYRWQDKRYRMQLEKINEEKNKLQYIHELERNKTESELIALRNEKLEAEVNYQHSEIASTAMHLAKKGELLSKLKAELTHLMKRLQNEEASTEVRKMIKSLTEDEHIDNEWENFSKHFDKVHSDFVSQLKKVHPQLTSNELKLCTYLRMNLSTKEIAQLSNISVRGVEVSRYRLRKKMGLTSEENFFDYLMKLQNNK
jgi:DNA-binding NarL/FixJ family response regulator